MVQIDQTLERFGGGRRPHGNRLPPRHAHVVVQLAVHPQRLLCRIPECVAGTTARQCFPGKQCAPVGFVPGQRFACPGRDRIERIGRIVPIAERVRQLAPHQQLIEILVCTVATARRTFLHDAECGHHAVVEVRGHPAHAIDARIVALGSIAVQSTRVHEVAPSRIAGNGAPCCMRDRPHTMIDLAL